MSALIGGLDSKRNASDDLCKSYRDENKKKDELIQQLCKIHPHSVTDLNTIKLVAPSRNNEVPALLVRIETLEDKLRKKQYEIDSRNEQLAVLKKESELNRFEFEKVDRENHKILDSNKKYEDTIQTYESLKHRSEYTIKLLQDQYRESQSKIAELEARIKNHLNDRERIDHMKSNVETKYQEFLISISRMINFDNITDREGILNKLASITDQNAFLNGKMHSLQEKLQTSENNAKDARETIVKLMNDFGGAGHDREELREAKNRFQSEKNDLKAQIDLLNNRLASLQKLYDDAKNELESKTNILLSLEVKVKEQQFSAQATETVFQSLLDSLAALIGTPFAPCAATEAAVKDRVKQLVKTVKDQSAAAEILDQRVLMLQKQFESQYETGKQLLDKTKDSDNVKQELINKIKSLEDELSAQTIFRDNIRCEKDRIIRYVRKLADLLQIDFLPGDNDTVGLLDLLEGRCQELMIKLSGGSWKCPRCVSINNPNTDTQKQSKRIASLKEELEAKDLQIQLLEKRMSEFTKSAHSSSCLMGDETNRDRVHRLQHQLEESQLEIEELRRALVRSQSADFEIHKQIKHKQHEELEQLTETVEKLDKVRQRQAKKIAGLKSQIEEKSQVLMQHGKRDGDFKQARQLLEEVRRREIKLSEFRSAIAQIIGVDIRCSPDPENEIKVRIQKLMAMARTSVNTPFTPYYLSQEMPQAFQQGYSNPSLGYTNNNNSNPISQLVPFSKSPNTRNQNPSNDDSGPVFGRRTQIPKNKIVFQSTDDKIKPSRARSTSPSKVDERKY